VVQNAGGRDRELSVESEVRLSDDVESPLALTAQAPVLVPPPGSERVPTNLVTAPWWKALVVPAHSVLR
jgi:hypothetical protein